MLLNNAVQNGGRHARSTVRLSAWNDDTTLVFRVEDDGEGYADPERTAAAPASSSPSASPRCTPDRVVTAACICQRRRPRRRCVRVTPAVSGDGLIDCRRSAFVIDDQPMARESAPIAQTVGAFFGRFRPAIREAIYKIRNNTPDIILCDYMLGEGAPASNCWRNCVASTCRPTETIFAMVTGEQSYSRSSPPSNWCRTTTSSNPFRPTNAAAARSRGREKAVLRRLLPREAQTGCKALSILAAARTPIPGRCPPLRGAAPGSRVHLSAGNVEQAERACRNILENAIPGGRVPALPRRCASKPTTGRAPRSRRWSR